MKRIISIILVVLLVATCAVLLVACGGIGSADEWTRAIDAYNNASAVTVKIEDNHKMMNQLANKERVISTAEIAFDSEKGVVHVSMDYVRRNFWESDVGSGAYEIYYVLDGTNVISYRKNLTTQQWEEPQTVELTSSDAANAYLREKYLKPTDYDGGEFPTFAELSFENFKSNLFGKYQWKHSDNRFNYVYALNFDSGKPSKFSYQHKTSNGSVDDSRKFSMTIEYSASITLPDDLPGTNTVQ